MIGDRSWREYTETMALEIASGKNGIARVVIAGLAELAQEDHLFQPLAEAINQYNIAHQLWDDLCDWQEDLRAGVPSLPIARVLNERPLIKDQRSGSGWSKAWGVRSTMAAMLAMFWS